MGVGGGGVTPLVDLYCILYAKRKKKKGGGGSDSMCKCIRNQRRAPFDRFTTSLHLQALLLANNIDVLINGMYGNIYSGDFCLHSSYIS